MLRPGRLNFMYRKANVYNDLRTPDSLLQTNLSGMVSTRCNYAFLRVDGVGLVPDSTLSTRKRASLSLIYDRISIWHEKH